MRELIGHVIATAALINIAEAVNGGRAAGFDDIADQIGAYQWSAILDEKTCDICAELDGKYFESGDLNLNTLKPPIHPACRCILVAVLKEELVNFAVKFFNPTADQVFDFSLGKFW